MNKLSKIFCATLIGLIIILAIVIYKYVSIRIDYLSLAENYMNLVEEVNQYEENTTVEE